VKDYWLDRAMKRLAAPPLTPADLQDLADPARLDAINASLAARPYRGLVVACPYTPDLWTRRSLDNAGPFARFLRERLLPRVRAEAPVDRAREATGVDGVSLGGRLSLLTALAEPGVFGAIGVTQGAFEPDEVPELARRTGAALRGGGLRLRLLTTDQDFYREAIEGLHAALAAAGAEHDHLFLPGPHGYTFNRGPGSIEMLLWHDRVLRGEPPGLEPADAGRAVP
jgi:enterochelin esterase-like enzyme